MLVQNYFKQIYQINFLKEFQNSTTCGVNEMFVYLLHEIHAFQEIVYNSIH